jgi:hypothetical protein
MQICPNCSTELEDGARFCGACGRPIDPVAPKAGAAASGASKATLAGTGGVPGAKATLAGPAGGLKSAPSSPPGAAFKSASAPAGAAAPPGGASRPNLRPIEALAATMVAASPQSFASAAAAPPPASSSAPTLTPPPPQHAPSPLHPPLAAPPPAAAAGPVRPAARPPETFVGRTLNHRYVVQDKIGEGGFGAVFRGRQIATGREVALKILHPHNVGDPTIVARFRREAEACSKLRDPHTVTTYDFDETEDGILYLVMELIRGQSLHQLQKSEGPLSQERVLGIIDQVAQSLGEAHVNGIVHRDMKPENVIVETRGTDDYVKVLDFGIAKVMSGDKEAQALTAVGQTLGTLEFMSPEQLRGIKLDGRSDIYALGMMAFEMLTGELPFKGAKTPIEIINFHMKDQSPPPSKMRPDLKIHPAVDEILLKMVAKSREERFADIPALREQITRAGNALKRGTLSLKLPNNYRVLAIAGAVAVAVAGALIFFLRH